MINIIVMFWSDLTNNKITSFISFGMWGMWKSKATRKISIHPSVDVSQERISTRTACGKRKIHEKNTKRINFYSSTLLSLLSVISFYRYLSLKAKNVGSYV